MQNLRKVVLGFIFTCLLVTPFLLRQDTLRHFPKRHFSTTLAQDQKTRADLVDLVDRIVLVKAVVHQNEVNRLLEIAAEERAAKERAYDQAKAQRHAEPPRSSGDCYAMKPAGFPDYIINRESRGISTANNGSHYGCVQLDNSYLTGDYAADWAKLWDNGRGACNWNPPRYCG